MSGWLFDDSIALISISIPIKNFAKYSFNNWKYVQVQKNKLEYNWLENLSIFTLHKLEKSFQSVIRN